MSDAFIFIFGVVVTIAALGPLIFAFAFDKKNK